MFFKLIFTVKERTNACNPLLILKIQRGYRCRLSGKSAVSRAKAARYFSDEAVLQGSEMVARIGECILCVGPIHQGAKKKNSDKKDGGN